MMLDLDRFKIVNDTLGHAAGDAMLRLFSALLRDELRKVDVAGRIGGDEFAVLMPRADLDGAMLLAERVRAKVAATSVSVGERQVAMSVSIGMAVMTPAHLSAVQALRDAEMALERAKLIGCNRVEVVGSTVASELPRVP
jgi:diguanylate cyclase (GGDEF)-like protein